MIAALHAEWTKTRTLARTAWLLAGAVGLTVLVSAIAAGAVHCPTAVCPIDPARTSLAGADLGQAVIALAAVGIIADEYHTGLIRLTLTAMPGRGTVLAAKAIVLTGLVLLAGAVAVVGSAVAGHLLLAANGYPAPSPASGPMLRAILGTTLYLGLIALLGLGVATALRGPAAAIGTVLGLLYLAPILTNAVSDPRWQQRLQEVAPMSAGLAVQDTVGSHPIAPWAGLGVLAAWSAGALVIGWLVLRLRDA